MEPVKLGVVSCAYLEAGFFHAYAELAQIQEVDAVVHLGDYIYEYGPSKAPWTVAGRRHFPEHEIVSLDDYRKRYAQYRLDPSLQSLHAAHPMIPIWDDHEIANNSYSDGADNHQALEGDYRERRSAAIKAYYEWLKRRNANLEYVNVRDHGFLLVEFSQESAKAEWIYVRNIKEPLNWKVSHQRVRYVHPWTSNMLSKSK
jgi:alkaline phosphatase D